MTHRTPWSALPPEVVQVIEAELGAAIVGVREAAEGFSPAVAASVELANGRTAFLKACTEEVNAQTCKMQRHEAMVVRQLPASVPTPRLLFAADIDEWQVLAFEHVEAQPVTDPLAHMRSIDALYATLEDVRVDSLIHFFDHHTNIWTSWSLLNDEVGGFDELVALESRVDHLRSDERLLHCDARDDNALVGADGRVYFVDWANACEGPPFLDAVAVVPSLVMRFGASVPDLVAESRLIAEQDPQDVVTLVAGLAGYFAHKSTLPAPPNMPTVRPFQRAQAIPMLAWLHDLVGDRITVPTMDDIDRALAPSRGLA